MQRLFDTWFPQFDFSRRTKSFVHSGDASSLNLDSDRFQTCAVHAVHASIDAPVVRFLRPGRRAHSAIIVPSMYADAKVVRGKSMGDNVNARYAMPVRP